MPHRPKSWTCRGAQGCHADLCRSESHRQATNCSDDRITDSPTWLFDANASLLFVHPPKTGDLSVVYAARRAMSETALDETSQHIEQVGRCSLQWPRMAIVAHWTGAYALSCIRQHLKISRPIVSFAAIRRPVERRISAYRWLRRESHHPNCSPKLMRCNYSRSFSEYVLSGDYRWFPADNAQFGSRWGSTFGLPQTDFLAPCTVAFQFERMDKLYSFLRASYYPAIRNEQMNAADDSQKLESVVVSDEARARLLQNDADDEQLWAALDRAGGVLDPCRVARLS